MKIEFVVPDMTCGHCVKTITTAVHEVAPGVPVSAVRETHRVIVDGVNDAAAIKAAIVAAGYTPQLMA